MYYGLSNNEANKGQNFQCWYFNVKTGKVRKLLPSFIGNMYSSLQLEVVLYKDTCMIKEFGFILRQRGKKKKKK